MILYDKNMALKDLQDLRDGVYDCEKEINYFEIYKRLVNIINDYYDKKGENK